MHARSDNIIAAANELVGVRYRHQGRTLHGIDCVGVPIYIAAKLGIKEWDTTAYGPRPNVREFDRLIMDTGAKLLPFAEMSSGDMLRMNYQGWPVHIGIYEVDSKGQEWIIHAYASHKMVTRDSLTDHMKQFIQSVWRFPE